MTMIKPPFDSRRLVDGEDIRAIVAREYPDCATPAERHQLADRLGITPAQLWNLASRVRAYRRSPVELTEPQNGGKETSSGA